MQTAPRVVIGYHGCPSDVADRILSEGQFLPSTKAYDWLGEGVYFWEYAPYRALVGQHQMQSEGGTPAVHSSDHQIGTLFEPAGHRAYTWSDRDVRPVCGNARRGKLAAQYRAGGTFSG